MKWRGEFFEVGDYVRSKDDHRGGVILKLYDDFAQVEFGNRIKWMPLYKLVLTMKGIGKEKTDK
jgi:hypothetical protein